MDMKNYLSFGGGVNSVAAYFLGRYDESVFCDTGSEYPETYEFINKFVGKYPLTILNVSESLYEYSWKYRMVPATWPRWCTKIYKIKPFMDYIQKPAFKNLAFSTDESKRAKISIDSDVENRFPLIENNIDRDGCKDIIKQAGLSVPHRSSCWFCPFQKISEWKELRMNHPDLFCKAEKLENRNMEYRKSKGKRPMYLYGNARSLRSVVEEKQSKLWAGDEYPPCECML